MQQRQEGFHLFRALAEKHRIKKAQNAAELARQRSPHCFVLGIPTSNDFGRTINLVVIDANPAVDRVGWFEFATSGLPNPGPTRFTHLAEEMLQQRETQLKAGENKQITNLRLIATSYQKEGRNIIPPSAYFEATVTGVVSKNRRGQPTQHARETVGIIAASPNLIKHALGITLAIMPVDEVTNYLNEQTKQ